jgi:hypothetical protein
MVACTSFVKRRHYYRRVSCKSGIQEGVEHRALLGNGRGRRHLCWNDPFDNGPKPPPARAIARAALKRRNQCT